MAKINVEVIDSCECKFGAPTKVEWRGAEYVKVDRPAKAGDIVRNVGGDQTDMDDGSFYEVIVDAIDDGVYLYDNADDRRYLPSRTYETFAKVSAKTASPAYKRGDLARVVEVGDEDPFEVGEIVRLDEDDTDEVPFVHSLFGAHRRALLAPYQLTPYTPTADDVITAEGESYVLRSRPANLGEKVLVVAEENIDRYYKNGDVLTVSEEDRWAVAEPGEAISLEGVNLGVYHREYLVIEPAEQAQPADPRTTRYLIALREGSTHVVDSSETDAGALVDRAVRTISGIAYFVHPDVAVPLADITSIAKVDANAKEAN